MGMLGQWRKLFWLVILATIFFANLSGCSKEQVSRNVYEGVRMKDESGRQPTDPEKMPAYDEYQRDRQSIIEDDK